MKINDLRERITLQTLEKTPDEMGGYTESWTDATTVWACFKAVTKTKCAHYQVSIRPGIKVDPTMHVKWQGKLFAILDKPLLDSQKDSLNFFMILIGD